VNRAEVRRTEAVIELLDMAVQEWETRADRKVSLEPFPAGPPSATYDMALSRPDILTTTDLVERMRRNEDVNTILTKIKPDQLVQYDDGSGATPVWLLDVNNPSGTALAETQWSAGNLQRQLVVLDAWGKPIIVLHPGWLFRNGLDLTQPDLDGTVRNPQDAAGIGRGIEDRYGIAKNRAVCFMSAGPDGLYGDLGGNAAEREAVQDNIYSYQVDLP
jgi:hypothetical protein